MNLWNLLAFWTVLEISLPETSASVCAVSFWEAWSPCTGNCKFALKVRNRDVLRPPFPEKKSEGRFVIRPCPPLFEVMTCRPTSCFIRESLRSNEVPPTVQANDIFITPDELYEPTKEPEMPSEDDVVEFFNRAVLNFEPIVLLNGEKQTDSDSAVFDGDKNSAANISEQKTIETTEDLISTSTDAPSTLLIIQSTTQESFLEQTETGITPLENSFGYTETAPAETASESAGLPSQRESDTNPEEPSTEISAERSSLSPVIRDSTPLSEQSKDNAAVEINDSYRSTVFDFDETSTSTNREDLTQLEYTEPITESISIINTSSEVTEDLLTEKTTNYEISDSTPSILTEHSEGEATVINALVESTERFQVKTTSNAVSDIPESTPAVFSENSSFQDPTVTNIAGSTEQYIDETGKSKFEASPLTKATLRNPWEDLKPFERPKVVAPLSKNGSGILSQATPPSFYKKLGKTSEVLSPEPGLEPTEETLDHTQTTTGLEFVTITEFDKFGKPVFTEKLPKTSLPETSEQLDAEPLTIHAIDAHEILPAVAQEFPSDFSESIDSPTAQIEFTDRQFQLNAENTVDDRSRPQGISTSLITASFSREEPSTSKLTTETELLKESDILSHVQQDAERVFTERPIPRHMEHIFARRFRPNARVLPEPDVISFFPQSKRRNPTEGFVSVVETSGPNKAIVFDNFRPLEFDARQPLPNNVIRAQELRRAQPSNFKRNLRPVSDREIPQFGNFRDRPTANPCGNVFGNQRCCRPTLRTICPDGQRPQRVLRWSRNALSSECIPYTYTYCGSEIEKQERPIKYEQECYEVCFRPEERLSNSFLRRIQFRDGFRVDN